MKCPKCNSTNDRVLDTRSRENGSIVYRRRKCMSCSFKYTTRETTEIFGTEKLQSNFESYVNHGNGD